MTELLENFRDSPKTHKQIEWIADICSNESYRKISQEGKNAKIQRTLYEEVKGKLGRNFEDKDKEIEL